MADPGIEPGQAPLRIGVGRKVHLRQVCRIAFGEPPLSPFRLCWCMFAAIVSVVFEAFAHE